MTDVNTGRAGLPIADRTSGIASVRSSRNSKWVRWAFPLTFAFAVAVPFALHHAIPLPAIAAAAAAMPSEPDYVMTITAKRLPTQCRGLSVHALHAACAPYLAGDAVVEMRPGR